MTKVLLINPPQKYFKQSGYFNVYFPIGLLSVAANIKDICEVKILDCLTTDFKIERAEDYILYGTPPEKIEIAIKNFNPHIVGISVPFTAQLDNALMVSRICKKVDPAIRVVFGGPDASVRYNFMLENNFCDFCVVGEGEKTFREMIEKFNSRISLKRLKGTAYKENGFIYYEHRNPNDDLDSLPFPAYELIKMEDYLNNPYLYISRSSIPKLSISMITSRGCPYNCIFCSIKLHMGNSYRTHSSDYVIRHIKFCIEKYGIKNFHFEDDNISLDKKRFEKILDNIITERLTINWDTPNGIRADTLDLKILKKVKQSGCVGLAIGIESGSQRVLDSIIKKKTSLDYITKVVQYCKKLRIRLYAFYVIGFPGEKIIDMRQTINFALKLLNLYDVIPWLLIATPLYGTELYDTCIKKGIINKMLTDREFSIATQPNGEPMISTEDFSTEDIKHLIREYEERHKSYLFFYALRHPFYILNRLNCRLKKIRLKLH